LFHKFWRIANADKALTSYATFFRINTKNLDANRKSLIFLWLIIDIIPNKWRHLKRLFLIIIVVVVIIIIIIVAITTTMLAVATNVSSFDIVMGTGAHCLAL
jgi:hypothetical protein